MLYKQIICLLSFLACLQVALFAQIDFSTENHVSHPLLDSMHTAIQAGNYERITSVVVEQNGKVVYEQYYNGNDSTSQHNTRSCTKSMATLLTGIAIEKGYIKSEKDRILSYLKPRKKIQNPDPRKDAITIEDLLTMSSCLECDDNNSVSRGNEERMYIIEDWTQFLLDLPIYSYPWGPKPHETKYGRVPRYCTAGAACMADVVQSAAGIRSDSLLIQHLLRPLGIKDYTLHYSPLKVLNTAGGSEYRSRDFLKIISMCRNGGKWNGKQILASSWLEKATKAYGNPYADLEYGYLLWLNRYGEEGKKLSTYYMSGNGGNKVMAIPEANMSVVITTQNYNNRNAHSYTDELLNKYIVPALKP
ncbi:MAG: serine hydrolase domain-containing protein [Bacteroidia bacterium]